MIRAQQLAGSTLQDDEGVVDVEREVVERGLVGVVVLGLEDGDDPPRGVVEESAKALDQGELVVSAVELVSSGGKSVECLLDDIHNAFFLSVRRDGPSSFCMFELKFSSYFTLADVTTVVDVRSFSDLTNL